MSDRLLKESDVLRAVDKRIEELSQDPVFVRKNGNRDVAGVKKHILAIPSADRPQGKWIDKTIPVSRANPYGGIIVGTKCSVCEYDGEDEQFGKISRRIVERFNFCPNCGAKMKGADDE